MFNLARLRTAVAALLLVVTVPATAQPDDNADLLEEFVHYARIARPDLATAYAQALLQSGISDAELARLVDEGANTRERFEAAILRAHRTPELADLAAVLEQKVHRGRLDLARDAQRIDEAIDWLVGPLRRKMIARELLAEAGEYAVPDLLRALVESDNERLRTAAREMLIEIGRQAVTPLCVALLHLDDANQRMVCGILAEIGHPHAAPYLLELALYEGAAAPTREMAERAYRRVGAVNGSLSDSYTRLAHQYFNESESLIAFPFETYNNVWSYDPFHGLEPTPVPTPVFSEIMAMRTTSKALDLDASNREALVVFVAANLRRANELPDGEDDPIYGDNPYSPEFYATVFGTAICLDVLSKGLDRFDTPLVRDAIAALSHTTGGSNLFGAAGDRQPLLEALEYPDRRVQYEAALTLARALPRNRFPGDVRVVPLLASAVRSGDESFAAVLADDAEERRIRTGWLEDLGFTVIAAGPNVGAVQLELEEAVGVDLVVVQISNADRAVRTLGELRVYRRTSAAPVLVVTANVDLSRLRREFRDDTRVQFTRSRVSEDAFAEAVDQVMQIAAGGRMMEAEAEAYAIEAIMALRDIAIAGTTAYDIADAEPALIQALETRTGGTRLSVADVLALIDSGRAQRVLFDAALVAGEHEQVELLERVARSVKRFGNYAEPRHEEALVSLIEHSGGRTADAAARVHGALVLPPASAIELIPGPRPIQGADAGDAALPRR